MSTPETTKPSADKKFTGLEFPYALTWKNPYETGVLLTKVLVGFAIAAKLTPQLFFRLFYLTVGALSLAEAATKLVTGTGVVSTLQPSRFLFLSDYEIDDYASCVTCAVRRATAVSLSLVDARDPWKGLQLSFGAYFVYQLLKVFSLRNLVFVLIIGAFSLPPLYLALKTEIDDTVEHLRVQALEGVDAASTKLHEKAGKQIDFVKNLLGPRGGFPGHANPSPVGEVPTAAAKPTEFTATSADATPAANAASTTTPSATELKDITAHFDSVPTLVGNVPVDHAKLNASIDAGKAESDARAAAAGFDTVPTLVGNVPVDPVRLQTALADDKKE